MYVCPFDHADSSLQAELHSVVWPHAAAPHRQHGPHHRDHHHLLPCTQAIRCAGSHMLRPPLHLQAAKDFAMVRAVLFRQWRTFAYFVFFFYTAGYVICNVPHLMSPVHSSTQSCGYNMRRKEILSPMA